MISPAADVADAARQGVLAVQGIDFCIDTNGENHHTNKFNLMTRSVDRCLVVRRGQAFKLDIVLSRPYDASKDAVSFIFEVPDETSATVPLLKKGSEIFGTWTVTYEGQIDSHLMVAVTPAADCIVASWKLQVDTRHSDGNYKHPLSIYVLFNPWCLTDSVYMPDDSHRDEFVLEDKGVLVKLNIDQFQPLRWNYAQYEKDILDCALYLVTEIGKVKGRARSDPIRTCRALSAAINTEDDNGVIVGKWPKNGLGTKPETYIGGNPPWTWDSSLNILQDYYKEKNPIKFGQCWVFAGLLTTICRALGIPCRPVTGTEVVHDTDGSLTLDIIIDDKENKLEDLSKDREWNFHVWNEVWMERPDLGPDYGGWQALDSTPQEKSEGILRCGPSSLRAVRNGEIQKPYDTAFMFATVNADRLTWKYCGKNQPLQLFKSNATWYGQKIVTKAVGKMKYEYLTNTYKYPEGTPEERMTMEKALRKSDSKYARDYLKAVFNDVTFDFDLQDDIKIGQDFNVILHVTNRASQSHQVQGNLRVDTATRTGNTGDEVKRSDFNINLKPESKEVIKMLVTFDDYYKKLGDQASFKIACQATIVDTKFDYSAQRDFRVRNPDIKISIDGEPVSHQEVSVNVKVQNSLPIPLTKGKFYIQGPGLDEQLEIELKENVAPGSFATAQFKLMPPWADHHQISAKFTSMEMKDVDGFLSLTVGMPAATTNGMARE
ncbi:annulin-like [Spodoptera litura]|uniref:Annulin-like n=1 Tax=Spodoptera litura TaxID=69820 RepID=A0A9J7IPZ4_SPOLT|nr:annulin-like [Spodoptera litura]